MKFDDEEVKSLIEKEWKNSLLKNFGNGLFLSQEEIFLLKKYHISYPLDISIKELIYILSNLLFCCEEEDIDALEQISTKLSDFYYYNYVRK